MDRSVRLWDVATGDNIWAREGHRAEVFAITFSDDGQLVLSGALDDFVIVWNVATGLPQESFATYDRTGIRGLADYNNALYIIGDNTQIVEVNIGFVPYHMRDEKTKQKLK